jgi:outer membrane receptor protein involved in Fe transport
MNYRLASTVTAILAASAAQSVHAQQAASGGGLEEVVVTAQRRVENLQDVPIAVQALTSETLSQLNVSTIDDFIKYLPSVTTANLGPAQGNIYMRGLSVGALGTQGQGSVGQWPNVAVYLDDQSTQIPGRNLDVYAADLERIEVLEGPQGTLFGAGAQAGVLRYITNKPKLDLTEGKASASYGTTAHGRENSNAELVLNLPLIDQKMAVRAVIYTESRGGYIDNVGSTFTRRPTDLGIALRTCNAGTAGAGCVADYNAATPGTVPTDSVVINNYNIAQKDINPVNYKGLRVGLAYQVNDDWDVLLTQSFQDMETSGVFYQHPVGSEGQPLKPLQVTLFNNGHTTDKFSNTALTVNGKAGPLDLVYSGAYLTRQSDQIQDYTNYARGVYGTYYQCTGYSGNSVNKCYSPSATWHDKTHNANQSHEFRLTTPSDWRLRAVGGLFWEKRELNDQTDWLYKTVPECTVGGPKACFFWLDPANTPKFETASFNNKNRRNPNTGFFDDFQRTYKQAAAFASVDFDILDNLTITGGTRYYDISNEMLGGNVGSFYCKQYGSGTSTLTGPCTGPANGNAPYGTNLNAQKPHSSTDTGFKSRVNLSWKATPDVLFYATWSEGFRPGGFNRGKGSGALKDANGVPQWYVPLQYDSDDLTNIELGWKTLSLGNRLQFNGAIYQESWKNVQTGIFAPQLGLGNLTVGLNGPEYRVRGIEAQVVAQATEGLTIQGSASYNKSELTNSPTLVNNNPNSPTFGEPITDALVGGVLVPVTNVYGKKGDALANSPQFQANLRARYEWDMTEYHYYGQVGVAYQDSSFSSATIVNQYNMPSWTTFDASFGVAKDQWTVELIGTNLTDENKSLFTSAAQFIVAEVPMRPRTLSLKVGYKFADAK